MTLCLKTINLKGKVMSKEKYLIEKTDYWGEGEEYTFYFGPEDEDGGWSSDESDELYDLLEEVCDEYELNHDFFKGDMDIQIASSENCHTIMGKTEKEANKLYDIIEVEIAIKMRR